MIDDPYDDDISRLMRAENIGFREAVERIARQLGIKFHEAKNAIVLPFVDRHPEGQSEPPSHCHPNGDSEPSQTRRPMGDKRATPGKTSNGLERATPD